MASQINSDSLPSKDLLGREKFAIELGKSLVHSFKNGSDSLVVGINGAWGSGKTTLLHFLAKSIRKEIPEKKERIIFDFNPWMFSGREELQTIFLNQLSKELGKNHSILKSGINYLADAIKAIDSNNIVNASVHAAAGPAASLASKALKQLTREPSIRKLKEKIDKAILEQKVRIFIFIDDLDRLTPKEITEVFQLVKLNANFKNAIFVIAFDKEAVTTSIEHEFKINGEKYLDKIIQVDYRIPDPLPEQIKRIFFDTLHQFHSENGILFQKQEIEAIWLLHGLDSYFQNVRDIHRYMNALKVRLPSIHKDVNVAQFLMIEAIRIFDYPSYLVIQENYKRSIQLGPNTNSTENLKTIKKETSKNLYKFLFISQKAKDEIGRFPIHDFDYFDRYFALSISSREISEELFQVFIADPKNRYQVLNETRSHLKNMKMI
jgi:predicted KAP-like P-loop ATPase